MNMIPTFSLKRHNGFVSGSTSLFTSTNQIVSSCNIRREFDFPGVRNRQLSLSLRSAKSLIKSKVLRQLSEILISAAHKASSSYLDKGNQFVSKLIYSPSTKYISEMTSTLNPAGAHFEVDPGTDSTNHERVFGRDIYDLMTIKYRSVV